eukprot:403371572
MTKRNINDYEPNLLFDYLPFENIMFKDQIERVASYSEEEFKKFDNVTIIQNEKPLFSNSYTLGFYIDFCYFDKVYDKYEIEKVCGFKIMKHNKEIQFCSRGTQIDHPTCYHKVKQIGVGAHSQVNLAIKRSQYNGSVLNILKQNLNITQQKRVAIKAIKKSLYLGNTSQILQLKNEIYVHRKLNKCVNALKLFKVFETDKYLYLILEYQEGGSMLDTIRNNMQLMEIDVQTIMAQILLATDFMHSRNIIHRDLKLDNILLSSSEQGVYEVRIADFGLAMQLLPGQKLTKRCGTPTYIAPEILKNSEYDLKADIFSLGSIMYNLLTGRYLFEPQQTSDYMIMNKICNLDHLPEQLKNISPLAKDLLYKLLKKKPEKRISVREALLHPWFQSDREALCISLEMNKQLCLSPIKRLNQNASNANFEDYSSQIPSFGIDSFVRGNNVSLKQLNDCRESQINYYEIIQQNRRSKSQLQLTKFKSPQTMIVEKTQEFQIKPILNNFKRVQRQAQSSYNSRKRSRKGNNPLGMQLSSVTMQMSKKKCIKVVNLNSKEKVNNSQCQMKNQPSDSQLLMSFKEKQNQQIIQVKKLKEGGMEQIREYQNIYELNQQAGFSFMALEENIQDQELIEEIESHKVSKLTLLIQDRCKKLFENKSNVQQSRIFINN